MRKAMYVMYLFTCDFCKKSQRTKEAIPKGWYTEDSKTKSKDAKYFCCSHCKESYDHVPRSL